MNATPEAHVGPPRFEDGAPLLLAGLRGRYTPETMQGIAAQWQRFAPYIGHVPGQIGRIAYGAGFNAFNSADRFEYLCGVAVADASGVPKELSCVSLPAQRYAVFSHGGPASTLSRTVTAIWRTWLPSSDRQLAGGLAGAPDFLERYGEKFDPQSGSGDIEVWIPLKS